MLKKRTFIVKGCLWAIFLVLCSCSHKRVAPQYRAPRGGEFLENKVVSKTDAEYLAGIQSIAILPFIDSSSGENHTLDNRDLNRIAERFANHLIASSTFENIMYPQQALEVLMDTPFNIMRKDDLKEIGNLLKVDAILFGKINQYNMYYPPRLSISMKFYLTSLGRFANAEEVSALAHSGVPLQDYNPTFFKQLWNTSAYYDGSNKAVLAKVDHYLKTHKSSIYGFDKDRILRTKFDFFNFIAYDLSNSLNCNRNVEEKKKPGIKEYRGKKRMRVPSGYFHR